MANDFAGDASDFALVVPVPTVLTQEQIQVGDLTTLERLDAYSAPRLVEYFDDDPCAPMILPEMVNGSSRDEAEPSAAEPTR